MTHHNMFELQQMVLLNVRDDLLLFEKEIRKSLLWLTSSELLKLYEWLVENFTENYIQIADKNLKPQFSTIRSK